MEANRKSDPVSVPFLWKWFKLTLLSAAGLLAMSLWFSASAVVPQLATAWDLSSSQKSWMTMSVQIGFVLGALLSALLNLADRISARHLFAASAFAGALVNAAIPVLGCSLKLTLMLRIFTGATLAGVYPPGMKLVATWCKEDRGLGIGLFVGALAVGSAVPHLLNALPVFGEGGMPSWRLVLLTTSALSTVAALIVVFLIEPGPFMEQTVPFDWRLAGRVLAHKPTRLANFGYLGHMWELYAMWTWVPMFLIASYEKAALSLCAARLAGFGVIAVGVVGCVLAGSLADRVGRTTVASWSLAVSGACAASAGFFYTKPAALTVLCLVWGMAVVADSAQFSAAVSELTDPGYVGTSLTMQTCLGFLLTLLSIRIIPPLVNIMRWEWVFTILVIGPILGIWSMLRLRRLPEALGMASGHR